MQPLLTAKELMALLRISRSTLYRLADAGMPCIGYGKLRRFDRDAVLQWYAGENAESE
jgi:excisionase family DNA binding protein